MSQGVKGVLYGHYEHELEKEVREGPMPRHIAIIMDGNRRYAESEGTDLNEGHNAGKRKLFDVAKWCIELGIPYITVYAFSTENFSRDEGEVDFLMDLANTSFMEMADHELIRDNEIRLRAIGSLEDLPQEVRDAIAYAEERTRDYTKHTVTVCIAYGGRQEIVDAAKKIAQKVKDGEIEPDDITEDTISMNLYASDLPDPDLVLRTSGEVRISNFLLWQLAYSELYFTDVYWPGFRRIDLLRAVRTFQQRTRRFGS